MTRIDAATAARLVARSAGAPAIRSDGERALETQLRQIQAPAWSIEHRFDSARMWRFDFAWPELLVAVEVEGGAWSEGRHVRGDGFERDCAKYNEAAIQGWLVIRVTTDQVERGEAIGWIQRAIWVRSSRR